MSAVPSARAANVTVRDATWADARPISEMLARAFSDDPFMLYLIPDEQRRARVLPRVFRLLLKMGLPHHGCHVTSGFESATYWRPPGAWHVPFWQYIVNGPEMLGIFGSGVTRVMNAMDMVEKRHPKERHWYLQTLGTDPAKQGKGYAGAIMRHQLAVADAAHLPCYLESSKSTNIPIYQTFGFKVTGEISFPKGPTIWSMWRDARA